jgi:serine phosphatase RsbU (regulator of sigma subunit)
MELIELLRSKLESAVTNDDKLLILNELSWELRYINELETLKFGEEAYKLAFEKNDLKATAKAQLNIAASYFIQSESEKSLDLLFKAYEYFKTKQEEWEYAATCCFIGHNFESIGNYEKGLEYCQRSLTAATNINYKEGEADVLGVIGLIKSRLCDYTGAFESFQRSLKIREELKAYKAMASSLNLIARTYSLTQEYEKALDYYTRSLNLRIEQKHASAIPWCYLGLASTYESMNDSELAIKYYKKGTNLSQRNNNQRCKLQCLLGMGRVLLRQCEYDGALKCLREAMRIAIEIKAVAVLSEVYFSFSDYYEKTKDFSNALKFYKKHQILKEEILNNDTHNKLRNQQIGFAIEKSEKEKEIFQLRNVELKNAYDIISLKNKETTDSINYAKHIQEALLPQEDLLGKYIADYFILYLPRNIVSGDFYWFAETNGHLVFTVADCTGHGVPGALLSMLGISLLNDLIARGTPADAADVLNQLRIDLKKLLNKPGKNNETYDGMDMALGMLNIDTLNLYFSGAYNPLIIVRNNEVIEIKGNNMPVGNFHGTEVPFENYLYQLQKNDCLYLFSDGYADQFGGESGKKIKIKVLKEMFCTLSNKSMERQKVYLVDFFTNWKGNNDQVDDVCILGIRV